MSKTRARKLSAIEQILQVAWHIPGERGRRGVNVLFEGLPGTAKTALIEKLSGEWGFYCKTFLLNQTEPTDLLGMPYINKAGFTDYAPQRWCYEINRAKYGVVFVDELNTAGPEKQAPALNMLTHGKVGNYQLGKHVVFVAAQNPPKAATGGWPLSPAMANRWIHIDWNILPFEMYREHVENLPSWYDEEEVSRDLLPGETYEEYIMRLQREGEEALMKQIEKQHAQVEAEDERIRPLWASEFARSRGKVMGFLQANQTLRHQFPEAEDRSAEKAWASDRVWSMFMRLDAGCRVYKTDPQVRGLLLRGAVGEGPAVEFESWEAKADLPTPEDVLDKNVWTPNEERPDICYAVLGSCNALLKALDRGDPSRVGRGQNYWKLIHSMRESTLSDLVLSGVETLVEGQYRPSEGKIRTDVLSSIGAAERVMAKEEAAE